MATESKVKGKPRKTTRLTPSGEETIMDLFMKFTLDEAGAPAVEYAILVACIATVIALSVSFLGVAVKGLFDNAVAKWPGG
jgi:Flp pilus assembly pilin Flp